MARDDQTNSGRPAASSDEAIWQYCRVTDAELDEAEQLLDLAGFADSRLDADEHDRLAALLMTDIGAAGDVSASRSLAARSHPDADEAVIARASALVAEPAQQRGQLIPFRRVARPLPSFFAVARWGSLAAAIVMASWIGFALGNDASVALSQINQSGDESFIGDLVDPSGGVLRSISDGLES